MYRQEAVSVRRNKRVVSRCMTLSSIVFMICSSIRKARSRIFTLTFRSKELVFPTTLFAAQAARYMSAHGKYFRENAPGPRRTRNPNRSTGLTKILGLLFTGEGYPV